MDRTVEEIEDLRLKELRKQAAWTGPKTDPAILIEIQELSNRQHSNSNSRRQFVNQLDYDFLMNVVAAALMRIGAVENNQNKNDRQRYWRQLVHDIWMIAITVMVFLLLLMSVYSR